MPRPNLPDQDRRKRDIEDFKDAFERFQEFCKENGITIVLAAGNGGDWPHESDSDSDSEDDKESYFAGDVIPTRYAEPDNELIVVGGVYGDGVMVGYSTQPGTTLPGGSWIQDLGDPLAPPDAKLGSVDIYAQAEGIVCFGVGGAVVGIFGTSYSSPMVVSQSSNCCSSWITR